MLRVCHLSVEWIETCTLSEKGGGGLEHLLHPLGYVIAILFTGNTMMVPDDQSCQSKNSYCSATVEWAQ